MARPKKITTEQVIEKQEVKMPPVNSKTVIVIGTGALSLKKGKEYEVSRKLAETLINKGAAKLK